MHSYSEVLTQEDMERLLGSIAGFHDSMTKEIHLINRAAVLPDRSMIMGHRYDAQVLIQSQWEPIAIELVFVGVNALRMGEATEYWGATGIVENREAPVAERRITMKFDGDSFAVTSEGLYFRNRPEWTGHEPRFGREVPSAQAVVSRVLSEKWRQCSQCADTWEVELSEEFSRCPGCGAITQLPQVQRSKASPGG